MRALVRALALVGVLAPSPGRGQDFAPVVPGALSGGAASLLDDGLPAASDGVSLESGITRWFGLDALATRHLALGAGWRGVRVAAGVSQTGDPELGWTSFGAAAGGATHAAGGAVRAVARRDRASPGLPGPPGAGGGYELGAGAWARAGERVVLHASAPQILLHSEAPPLPRGFELGATMDLDDATLWLAVRSAPRGQPVPPDHELGVALRLAGVRAWALVRDRPARAGIGLSARVRAIGIAAAVESHPVLGETTRLALILGQGEAP